jgi:hypothetical protein
MLTLKKAKLRPHISNDKQILLFIRFQKYSPNLLFSLEFHQRNSNYLIESDKIEGKPNELCGKPNDLSCLSCGKPHAACLS